MAKELLCNPGGNHFSNLFSGNSFSALKLLKSLPNSCDKVNFPRDLAQGDALRKSFDQIDSNFTAVHLPEQYLRGIATLQADL